MVSRLASDVSHWPLVVLEAPVRWGAETVARYARETTACVARGEPFVLVLDLSRSALLPAATRDLLAAHRCWLFERARALLVAEVVVTNSLALREVFTIPRDLDVAPPQLFASALDEAMLQAMYVLRQRGVVVDSLRPRDSGVHYRPPRKAVRDFGEGLDPSESDDTNDDQEDDEFADPTNLLASRRR